ncbi:glycosyltransferase [Rhizobium helianthi]|uniref:Glycosyltransferase n=1 Tax=Rhizobium helianthi TaxID=1132695 RepID=A0ABW4M696_9HYPH
MMLLAGGAEVCVAGFQRERNGLSDLEGVKTIVLGHTADGRLAQRVSAVIKARLALSRLLAGLKRPDVVIARNLEMLALSGAASGHFGGRLPVVYECLDIHRLLLDQGMKGRVLRAAEARFARHASLLATSSPAFVENYFKPLSGLDLPVLLLENKVLALEGAGASWPPQPRMPMQGEPWRIGWFGAIRCRKSFEILSRFAEEMEGRVEVVIRGRVSPHEFSDFEGMVARSPHVSFHGAYKNPEDLADIYREVQFVWAIDFFEEGLNSEWLLPNRLYEGSLHGAIPIALSSTETGRFLKRRGMGLLLDHADPDSLTTRFFNLTPQYYLTLMDQLRQSEASQWMVAGNECQALTRQLSALTPNVGNTPGLAVSSQLQSEG